MSEAPVGLKIAEKLFGLVDVIIGALMVYYTYVSPPKSPPAVPSGWLSSIFIAAGLVLIGVGIFLVITEGE